MFSFDSGFYYYQQMHYHLPQQLHRYITFYTSNECTTICHSQQSERKPTICGSKLPCIVGKDALRCPFHFPKTLKSLEGRNLKFRKKLILIIFSAGLLQVFCSNASSILQIVIFVDFEAPKWNLSQSSKLTTTLRCWRVSMSLQTQRNLGVPHKYFITFETQWNTHKCVWQYLLFKKRWDWANLKFQLFGN